MILRFLAFTALVFLTSCGGSKEMVSEPTFTLVVFGETGGIVGTSPQYGLSGNGMLMKTAVNNGEPEIIGTLPQEKLKHIFYLVQEAKKVDEFRHETANLNRKIIIQADAQNKSYYWQMPDEGVPEAIKKLYSRLSKIPSEINE